VCSAVQHWLQHAARPIAESTIAILDPDMLFLTPLRINTGHYNESNMMVWPPHRNK
jgi:hypothetical protein